MLTELNFDTYMAGLEHTQKEVVQSVFNALAESEYFLLLDFRRDRLGCGPFAKRPFRGSLFTQQELAIASFLGIEQLRFIEKGVECDGISRLLQGRPFEFVRDELVRKVKEKIEAEWSNGWKNALQIVEEEGFEPVTRIRKDDPRSRRTADFYHIVVKNLHNRKMARDCRVFLEFETGTMAPPNLCDHLEQKWAGMLYNQAVAIRPKPGRRRACACFIERDENGHSEGVFFHQFGVDTDSAAAAQPCPPGEYVLKFTVMSANFPPATMRFRLEIDQRLEIKLRVIPQS
jgi:hypothetical protein